MALTITLARVDSSNQFTTSGFFAASTYRPPGCSVRLRVSSLISGNLRHPKEFQALQEQLTHTCPQSTVRLSHWSTHFPPLSRHNCCSRQRVLPGSDQRWAAQSSARKHQRHFSVLAAAMAGSGGQTVQSESPLLEFPHICIAAQAMMTDLLNTLEAELGSELQPTETPEGVRSFKSDAGNAEGSMLLRAGKDRSYVDRMLVSSLHCELPFGTLDFATLTVLMGPATDAPHLLFEFPFKGNTQVTVVMDLLPRKDLAYDVEYLKRTYEDTALPAIHKQCEDDPRMERYVTPTLYIRCATSPTACLYHVDPSKWPSEGAADSDPHQHSLNDAIREVVHPKAKEVLVTWLDVVKKHAKKVAQEEQGQLADRDAVLLSNGIEHDLTSNLPRLFGQEVTDMVLDAFRKGV